MAGDLYSWVKAFHVVSVIAWMAGMLYLPRLFVYHCQVAPDSEAAGKFVVMERKLLRAIINPAMGATWILGITMIVMNTALLEQGWLHVKLACVIILSAIHGFLSARRKDFEAGKNTRSERFYRIINEVPALLMVIIVIMVIVRPF